MRSVTINQDDSSKVIFYLALVGLNLWGLILSLLVNYSTDEWQPGFVMIFIIGIAMPMIGLLISVDDRIASSLVGFSLFWTGFFTGMSLLFHTYTKLDNSVYLTCCICFWLAMTYIGLQRKTDIKYTTKGAIEVMKNLYIDTFVYLFLRDS